MDISLAQILVAGNMTLWLLIASLLFYYLFVMGSKTEDERKKRGLYLWGIKRFGFSLIWLSVGSIFILMSPDDWKNFCNAIATNVTYLIGAFFWCGFFSFVGYFFKLRLPKERKARGLDNGTSLPSQTQVEKKEKVESTKNE